jgi:hypothetical protein
VVTALTEVEDEMEDERVVSVWAVIEMLVDRAWRVESEDVEAASTEVSFWYSELLGIDG